MARLCILVLSLLLMGSACLCSAMPAREADESDPGDLQPDPIGDADQPSADTNAGSAENPVGDGQQAGVQLDSGDNNEKLSMTKENLGKLKDIWADASIPEVTFGKRSGSGSSGKLRDTMTGGGFRRPKIQFGNYYMQGR